MSKTVKASSTAVRKSNPSPTTDEIALRAYHIYLERRGAPGNPLDDWTRAESELCQKVSKSRGKPGPKLVAA
jgi:hypothetical protein